MEVEGRVMEYKVEYIKWIHYPLFLFLYIYIQFEII